jgi:hypothetical protein
MAIERAALGAGVIFGIAAQIANAGFRAAADA